MLKKCIVITISSIIILFAIFFISLSYEYALSYEDALSLATEVNRILTIMIVTASGVIIAITKISDMDKIPILNPKILALSKLANIFLNLNNVIWTILIIAGIFIYKLDLLFVYKYLFPNITVLSFVIFIMVICAKQSAH